MRHLERQSRCSRLREPASASKRSGAAEGSARIRRKDSNALLTFRLRPPTHPAAIHWSGHSESEQSASATMVQWNFPLTMSAHCSRAHTSKASDSTLTCSKRQATVAQLRPMKLACQVNSSLQIRPTCSHCKGICALA